MITTADIITRNFFRMMRSGALNESVEFEPMSSFKWQKLVDIICLENVTSAASRAVKNQQYEPKFNMPKHLIQKILSDAENSKGQNITSEMSNSILKKKMNKICIIERKSDNYSKETLDLFNLIIANCHAILNQGASIRLIIKLANYIRKNSTLIDYAKINIWLKELQMQKVAQLAGSILINNFAFKKETLPFVKNTDSKAATLMMQSITQRRKTKHNKGITYFEYAPLENASILLNRLKSRLDTIEE